MASRFFTICTMCLLAITGVSEVWAQPAPKAFKAQRKYDLIVNQSNDTLKFNRGLRELRGNSEKLNNRNILSDLLTGYLSLGTSTLMSASQNLLSAGIAYVKEAARDKRPDWEKGVMGESRFVKRLPMVTEVIDFYGSPSTIGALDPTDMKFSGFGCSQYITIMGEDSVPKEKEVFYISCSIRDDEQGLSRILNHSKFEVQVDEIRFDPFLANLPNDTLSISEETRIPFSFDTRKDMEFKVKANLYSSWINEAIMVNKDVPLGEFVITAKIDPNKLDNDSVFRYSRFNPEDREKVVYVTGDSFLVPRSYVGTSDLENPSPAWGTGQYRVDMVIEESCRINDKYYKTADGKKWQKDKWKGEWKKMNKRPKAGQSPKAIDMIFPQFANGQWVTTIIEPASTVLIQNENAFVTKNATKLRETWETGASAPTTPQGGAPAKK